ncbi:MAG TPA: HAD family phosphatase [Candidatus Limnocylindrales bacterium]|nr:HAD family phosphatase [Candidatus Limnocylindrales bacterium]
MDTRLAALRSPDAVLFDLDGTLVDTVETRIEAWSRTLGDFGIPTPRDDIAAMIGIDGRRLAREAAAAAGRQLDDDEAEAIDKRCGELFEKLNAHPRPLPGVGELVAVLESSGVDWAIATSSRKEQVAVSVEALRLPGEPRIVDASHVEHAKPAPDLLLEAASQLGIEPAGCWYVGDSTWDMVAAVAAGMTAIAVTEGAAVGAEALERAGAHAVVATLVDLVPAFADVLPTG